MFDYLDYDLISKNPKILCGFSDSTSLTNMITEKTGLVTFSGPTFKSFSSWETDYSFKKFVRRFIDEDLSLCDNDERIKVIKQGKGHGQLIGGNLSLIARMTVGKYKLNFDNKVLFIEELGLEDDPAMCSGNLYFMKQNGVFEKLKGIWVGNYEHEMEISLEKILLDVLEDECSFPIIKTNNFGHIDKKIVIPIGIKVNIDTNSKNKIELIEKCIK
ncbi:MAG: LD-carboxypeptidase [Clostridia bacterium]|nr:LD-carboxypeptidase [Clostridia bacterium]